MSDLRTFKKVSSGPPELLKLQSNVDQFLQTLLINPLLSGVLIEDVKLTTGITNKIEHKLDRELQGYIIVKKNANSIIYDSQSSNLLSSKTLNLLCTANVTISLWVF